MITKTQFIDEVIPNIQGFLPKEYANRHVVINEVQKSSGNYIGLILKDNEQSRSILPTVNMDVIFEHVKDNADVFDAINQTVREVCRIYDEHPGLGMDENEMLEKISSFEAAKDSIILVPFAMGVQLENVPILEKEGLRFTAKVDMGLSEEMKARATTQINDSMLERWGVSAEEVLQAAVDNLGKTEPMVFSPLSEVLERMAMKSGFEGVEDFDPASMEMEPMFLLSTRSGIDGASMIMSDAILEDVANRLDGNNFFIIPSSIHECLIVPVGASMSEDIGTVSMLSSMISEVNQEAVSVDERLSDKLFHYDAENKTFTKAEDYLANKEKMADLQESKDAEISENVDKEPELEEEVKGPKM